MVADFQPPQPWPEKLERTWSVKVGSGYATPLVEGDRIYQHARIAGNEVLWCLDANTGEVLWRVETDVAFRPGGGGERHGAGPKSTPTMAEGRIFTLSITGTLTAWSADSGEVLWQRDFRERLEDTFPYWGVSTSPLVEGNHVYAHVGSCEKGALFCLDTKSGEEIWVQDAHANCYSSPIVTTIAGVRQLIEFNHHGLCGVDVETGRLLWEFEYPHEGRSQNTPTPVFHEGLLVMGAEDRGMFAVQPKSSDGQWSVVPVWDHREVSLDMSSPVVDGDVVYGFSHFKSGQLFALEAKTGRVLWLGEPRAGENASLLAVSGYVLALTDRGELHVLRSNRERCEIERTYSVGESGTWTAPALLNDSILIKNGDELVRWSIPKE